MSRSLNTLPIDERIQRVASRVNRGIYTRLVQADYSNLGCALFDEDHMARDLGLSLQMLRKVLHTQPRENSCGWTLPKCPHSQEILDAASDIKDAAQNQFLYTPTGRRIEVNIFEYKMAMRSKSHIQLTDTSWISAACLGETPKQARENRTQYRAEKNDLQIS